MSYRINYPISNALRCLITTPMVIGSVNRLHDIIEERQLPLMLSHD